MSGLEDQDGDVESSSFRYIPVDLDDTEDLEKYEKGGFHPVHLGDVFDSRYKVTHKLGAGGMSTIWLARDNQAEKWVALKIVVANKSTTMEAKSLHAREATTLAGDRHFFIDGPNGRHICLVLPVLGSSGSRMSQQLECRLRPRLARKASYQATVALAGLHARGICHGDTTTANIVFSLSNLDRCSESEIWSLFGEPKTAPVETESGQDPGPEAPRYIVQTLDFLSATENMIQEVIDLIDYDQSFPISSPPTEILGTPVEFMAPEVCAGRQPGPASDVWALGCSIFRLRSGFGPFEHFESWSPSIALSFITDTLGDPPSSWQPMLFDEDGYPTKDSCKGVPLPETVPGTSLNVMVDRIYDEPPGGHIPTGAEWIAQDIYKSEEKRQKRFPPVFDHMIWKPTAVRIGNVYLGYDDESVSLFEAMPKISEEEASLLHDLLSKIFVYNPAERMSAEEMLSHPWFHMDEAEAVDSSTGIA